MSTSISEEDVKSLNELTESLGRNSKVAAPFFALGILATLVGAGIAIYFIISLSAQLEDAQEGLEIAQLELTQSQAALADANRSLEVADSVVKSAQTSESETRSAEATIAEAIGQVSESQSNLALAKRNVARVATALPTQTQRTIEKKANPDSLSGDWVDGYGSIYTIKHDGREFAYTVRYLRKTGEDSGIRGSASGQFENGSAIYTFEDNVDRSLTCSARPSAELDSIAETCTYPDGRKVTVTLVRT